MCAAACGFHPRKRKPRGASERGQHDQMPAFGPFAKDSTVGRRGQVAKKTTKHEKWALGHLNPFFGDWAISEIDIEGVGDYRAFN